MIMYSKLKDITKKRAANRQLMGRGIENKVPASFEEIAKKNRMK